MAYAEKRCYYQKMDAAFFSSASRFALRFMMYALLSICSTAILFASAASAHTLKTDGTISAALHFQPDDAPMSGKSTEYILFLTDSTKRFSIGDCGCTVIVKKDSKTISSNPMELNSQNIIGGSITFAKAGAYEVIFQGAPIKSGAFQPFTLRYAEQVAPNPDANHPSSAFIVGMSALVISMIAIAFLIKVRYNSLEGSKE